MVRSVKPSVSSRDGGFLFACYLASNSVVPRTKACCLEEYFGPSARGALMPMAL